MLLVAAGEAIDGLLADLQTITEVARTGVLSKRDIVIEPGETRPAAILFVDVVGFTELSRRLSSEALAKVIDRTFRIFELSVRAHGGYCDKVIGDAGLYVFAGHPNYPPMCEAALMAALKLAERLRQVNSSLAEMGLTLSIRQGVAFGNVTRQAVGSAHAQITVMGETVNLAQRLQAAARPNMVQTTIRVLEKAGDAFMREALGKLDLKGIGLVTAYNVSGLRQRPVQVRGAYLNLTPLIGRDGPLNESLKLISEWFSVEYPLESLDVTRADALQAQRNHLLMITGAPAVGKSRFAFELVQQIIRDHDVTYSIGHLTENATIAEVTAELAAVASISAANLVSRWNELCDNAATAVSPEYAGRQRAHLQLLAYVLGNQEVDASALNNADQRSFAVGCEMALRACCELAALEGKRVVLVVEDLQWLGELRGVLAGILARTCMACPLVVIATARMEYKLEPGSLHNGEYRELQLDSLSTDECCALLEAMLPGLRLPERVELDLHAKAGGIPYFYEDFVRMLIRRGLVKHQDGLWSLAEAIDELDIPEDLRALMLGRLDQLPEDARELARRASALGHSFNLRLLTEIEQHLGFEHIGHPTTELQELIAERLLRCESGERYYFEQSLLQEAAYDSLLVHNRVLIHQIAADVLERNYIPGAVGELELLAQLVHHLGAAGENSLAHERACQLLHAKAAMLNLEDWDAWVDLAIELYTGSVGFIAHTGKGFAASSRDEMDGEALAGLGAIQYPPSAGLHVALAELHWRRGNLQLAHELAASAVCFAHDNELLLWEAKAHHVLGNLHSDQGRMDEARQCFERGLEIRRQLIDQHGESNSLNSLGILHKSHGRLQEAEQFFNNSLSIRRTIGDRRGEGAALANLGLLRKAVGKMDEAKTCLEQSLQIFREIGDRTGEAIQLNNLGNLHSDQGRLGEARACYERSMAIRREIGDRHGEGVCLVNLGSLYADLGILAEARDCYKRSIVICRELGDRYGVGIALNSLGRIHAENGEIAQALECQLSAYGIATELKEPCQQAACLIHLARLYAWDGKLDEALHSLQECSSILADLQDSLHLCLMHCSWVYYHLATTGFVPQGSRQPLKTPPLAISASSAQEVLALAKQALAKAIAFMDLMGASAASEEGQQIAKARAAIAEFAQRHGIPLSNTAAGEA